MRNILTIVAASVLAVHSTIADPQITGTPDELRAHLSSVPGQVTISGSAERRVEADRAVVQLAVVSANRQLNAALATNAQTRTGILTELKTGGIAVERVHTSRLGATPIHSSYSGKVKEYQVKSTVRIHAETEKEIQPIAVLIDTRNDVSLTSLTSEVTKKGEVKAELLKAAFEQVQERRKLYESSLGVRLLPRSVGPPADQGDSVVRMRAGRGKGTMSGLRHASAVSGFGPAGGILGTEEGGISQFEEVLFSANISVTFDLLPAKEGRR
jgi:uncharacterized protein YggE